MKIKKKKPKTDLPDNFNHGYLTWRYKCIDCGKEHIEKNFGKEHPDGRYYCHGCNETKTQVYDKKNETEARP